MVREEFWFKNAAEYLVLGFRGTAGNNLKFSENKTREKKANK
jgi:hypothetical protein